MAISISLPSFQAIGLLVDNSNASVQTVNAISNRFLKFRGKFCAPPVFLWV